MIPLHFLRCLSCLMAYHLLLTYFLLLTSYYLLLTYYVQPAIDNAVLRLQRTHNSGTSPPVIFNTYQAST